MMTMGHLLCLLVQSLCLRGALGSAKYPHFLRFASLRLNLDEVLLHLVQIQNLLALLGLQGRVQLLLGNLLVLSSCCTDHC